MVEAVHAEELARLIPTPEFAAAVGACFIHSEGRRLEGGFTMRREDGGVMIGQLRLPRGSADNGGYDPANHVYFPDMEGSVGRLHSHPHHFNIGTSNSAMPSFGDLKTLLHHPDYPPHYIHGVIGRRYSDRALSSVTQGILHIFRPDTYEPRPYYNPRFAWIFNVEAAPKNKVPDALRRWGISHASLNFRVEGEAAVIEPDDPSALAKAMETLFAEHRSL